MNYLIAVMSGLLLAVSLGCAPAEGIATDPADGAIRPALTDGQPPLAAYLRAEISGQGQSLIIIAEVALVNMSGETVHLTEKPSFRLRPIWLKYEAAERAYQSFMMRAATGEIPEDRVFYPGGSISLSSIWLPPSEADIVSGSLAIPPGGVLVCSWGRMIRDRFVGNRRIPDESRISIVVSRRGAGEDLHRQNFYFRESPKAPWDVSSFDSERRPVGGRAWENGEVDVSLPRPVRSRMRPESVVRCIKAREPYYDSWTTGCGSGTPPLAVYGKLAGQLRIANYVYQDSDQSAWVDLLQDTDARLYDRLCATYFLMDTHPQARQLVEKTLRSEKLLDRLNAAQALYMHAQATECGEPWEIELMIELLAGGSLDGEEEWGTSTYYTNDKGRRARVESPQWRICQLMGTLKEAKAVPALIAVLERNPRVHCAARSLAEIGDPRGLPILKQLAEEGTGNHHEIIRAIDVLENPVSEESDDAAPSQD